jgi:hypothetical protein
MQRTRWPGDDQLEFMKDIVDVMKARFHQWQLSSILLGVARAPMHGAL